MREVPSFPYMHEIKSLVFIFKTEARVLHERGCLCVFYDFIFFRVGLFVAAYIYVLNTVCSISGCIAI